jgi:glyoxylase-like metal-dependent hydrolase (beta-lactamase superfamily II)/8-oxo-dGTP pyrophosphatase MutT (NUDIX family)
VVDPAAELRDAATLVILRDSEQGPRVLITVRPAHLRFMGGAWVFPGGVLAEADADPRWWDAVTLGRAVAESRLADDPDPDRVLGLHVCALREAFEEVGFVLGSGPLDSLERNDAEHPELFLARCLERGIVLDAAALVPGARWATPVGAPMRFDARFFFARAPEGWEPLPDRDEVERCSWLTPAEALAEHAAGRAPMAPPTVETLQMLDGLEDVAAILEAVRERKSEDVTISASRLSPAIHVVLAPNPGLMTGPGTNTYVVGRGTTMVIDPAVDDPGYLAKVQELGGRIAQILITHRHPDHVGGARELQRRTGAQVRAFGSSPAGDALVEPLSDGDQIEAGSVRLTTMHCPGHASDHLCFVHEESAGLFAGDNVLGEGTAVIAPPDGDMAAYMDSLERLSELDIGRIYPGHFEPLDDGREVIAGYIEHRRARERSIVDALERSESDLTTEEIVQVVYTDVSPSLHPVARFSVEAHLQMLRTQGRVRSDGKRWSTRTAG